MITSDLISSGFFNAQLVDGLPDRTYNAGNLTDYLGGLITDGVLANPSTNLQVQAGSGLEIIIKSGKAWVDGHFFTASGDIEFTIDAPDTLLPRIDSITLTLNKTERTLVLDYKKGTPATTPTVPALTNTEQIKELRLANIRVEANTTAITTEKITDTRLSDECGVVTALIEQVDTSTIFNQYNSALINFLAMADTALKNMAILRQYSHIYTTVNAGEQTISIPSSFDFVNGYDILMVLINGMMLTPAEYSVSGTKVNLVNALDVPGTVIELRALKNVNDSDISGFASEVTDQGERISALEKYRYFCTGTDDNLMINSIVNSFYAGTGIFAGVADNANLKLEICGNIGCTVTDGKVFSFTRNEDVARLVTLDFSRASEIALNEACTVFECDSVFIEKARISLVATADVAVAVSGLSNTLTDCAITIQAGVAFGIYGAGTLINSNIQTFGYTGNSCAVYLTSTGIMRVQGGRLSSHKTPSNTNECSAIYNNGGGVILSVMTQFPAETISGFTQGYSYNLVRGSYSIVADVKGVKSNVAGATGEVIGEITM